MRPRQRQLSDNRGIEGAVRRPLRRRCIKRVQSERYPDQVPATGGSTATNPSSGNHAATPSQRSDPASPPTTRGESHSSPHPRRSNVSSAPDSRRRRLPSTPLSWSTANPFQKKRKNVPGPCAGFVGGEVGGFAGRCGGLCGTGLGRIIGRPTPSVRTGWGGRPG
jgi:hypothetical protein